MNLRVFEGLLMMMYKKEELSRLSWSFIRVPNLSIYLPTSEFKKKLLYYQNLYTDVRNSSRVWEAKTKTTTTTNFML